MQERASGKIILAFAVVYLVWGSTFLAIRLAVETVPPLIVGGMRHFWGGVLLLAGVKAFAPSAASRRQLLTAIGVGMLTAGISNGSIIVAEKTVPSSIAAVSFTLMPLILLVMNWLAFEKKKPSWIDAIALPLGILGTAVVLGAGKTLEGTSFSPQDIALLLICPTVWALGSLISRQVDLPRAVLLSASVQMIGGGGFLLILATLNGDWAVMGHVPPSSSSLWGVIYLTLAGSLLGYTAFAYLVKEVDPRLTATYAFVNPVVALGLGLAWGEQILTPEIGIGATLAIASVTIVIVSRIWVAKRAQRLQKVP